MFPDFIVTIVSAAVIGLFAFFWRKGKSRTQKKKAIRFLVEQQCDDYWRVAFKGPAPDLSEIEGFQVSAHDAYKAAIRLGGVDIGQSRIRLRLRGASDDSVLITGISIKTKKAEPISDVSLLCSSAGANEVTILQVNLDEDRPEVWEGEERDFSFRRIGSAPFFLRNNITLNTQEYQDILLIAETSKYYVEWQILIAYRINEEPGELLIDLEGDPFRTTANIEEGFSTSLEWAWDLGKKVIPQRVWNDLDFE